jgi:hypothetical protein
MGEPKQRFVVKEFYVGDASFQRYGPPGWVWLRFKSSKTTEVFWKMKLYFYQFRLDVRTCGHGPRYTADNDAAETDVNAQKWRVVVWWLLLPQQSGQ